MTASLNNCLLKGTLSIAQACAITFQGNASNNLQQDAFFILDNWLITLKNKVYDSDGNVYDNGTAILVRFD